jgi:hypothetical protein
MPEILGRWMPPSDVRSHTGGLIAPDSIFFAPPPTEIGKVLSAQSGLRTGGSAVTRPMARKVIGLFALFGILVGGFIGAGFSHGQWPGIVLGALIGALSIGWPISRREGKRNDCTYVGTHGIARFPVSSRGEANSRGEVFLFADAVDLQTAFLGRNMGTNFNYQWKNARGKTLYKLEGGYYGNKRDIDPDSSFHFARAAEAAWSRYFLPQVKAELQRCGSYRFLTRRGLTGNQHAVIGPGYLDIVTGGKTFHNLAGDIDDIVVHQGWIIIRRKDAQDRAINSLDGSHGICYLSYGAVSNVKIFLTLLTQVVGVSWRDGE